jgi:Tol biopolymer transport system component
MLGRSHIGRIVALGLLSILAAGLALAGSGKAAVAAKTTRVSVSSAEEQANQRSGSTSISADGRFVVFESNASNLVAHDTNLYQDVFIRDRKTGRTGRLNVRSGGAQADNHSSVYSNGSPISANGRFVVFASLADNMVAGDTNGVTDIFVRDRSARTTKRVSLTSAGAQSENGDSADPAISANGRYVVFQSTATNLVAGDNNGHSDVFVRDLATRKTRRVSLSSGEAQANEQSGGTSISSDGRFVVFESRASNLVLRDTNGETDIFVRDRLAGTTRRVSVSSAEKQAIRGSGYCSISANGRFVAFETGAANLVPRDTNGESDVFVRDLRAGTTRRVSVSSSERQSREWSGYAKISAGGRFVVFQAPDTNLVARDLNGIQDIFVRDRLIGTTRRITAKAAGASNGNGYASITADGRFVTFESDATNHVLGDTNGYDDVFVRGPLR